MSYVCCKKFWDLYKWQKQTDRWHLLSLAMQLVSLGCALHTLLSVSGTLVLGTGALRAKGGCPLHPQ